MKAEERERICQEEYRIRQDDREDERRREDHRVQIQMQMMMVMMKPQVWQLQLVWLGLAWRSINVST